MSNPAFLVDGHMEMKFIQKVCPGKTVRRLNCNGSNVSTEAIAKRIATHCRIFHGKHRPIIIWVDREDRDTTPVDFVKELEHAISTEGVNDSIIVGVADRTVENWMIADEETVKSWATRGDAYPSLVDGFNGKTILRKIIDDYHETTNGVDILSSCYASRMMRSPSFKDFYDRLPYEDCWWLGR